MDLQNSVQYKVEPKQDITAWEAVQLMLLIHVGGQFDYERIDPGVRRHIVPRMQTKKIFIKGVVPFTLRYSDGVATADGVTAIRGEGPNERVAFTDAETKLKAFFQIDEKSPHQLLVEKHLCANEIVNVNEDAAIAEILATFTGTERHFRLMWFCTSMLSRHGVADSKLIDFDLALLGYPNNSGSGDKDERESTNDVPDQQGIQRGGGADSE